ncbi:MAG: hypothetical protein WCR42_13350 [bacterium]
MEPIPYFYEHINRCAIVVKQKQPFLDWINNIYPESPLEKPEEGNIYLVREKDFIEEIEKWLKRHFDEIFQNELNDWHTDQNDWPQKRTFKIFTEWFDYEIHTMILDIEDTIIEKE